MTAFIFLLVFVPVGWFIYRMLRYTAKTVGDESPLETIVEFRISAWDYHTRGHYLLLIGLALMLLLFLAFVLLAALPSATKPWQYVASALFVLGLGYTLFEMTRAFRLEDQYWAITKDRWYRLDPTRKSLTLSGAETEIELTREDLECIEVHFSSLPSKSIWSAYSYYIFRTKDGRRFYVNHISSYFDFLLETYFKDVPQTYIAHKIPWIKPV